MTALALQTTGTMKVARVYLRVSTQQQDLERQERIVTDAERAGYYIAGVYREKASGVDPTRKELNRMIADLRPGDVVIAEKMDRLTRMPLPDAEKLIARIRAKGAKVSVPGVIDLSEIAAQATGTARIVLDTMQELVLKLALQMARDDYEQRRERQRQGITIAKRDGKYKGTQPNRALHQRIAALRADGHSIAETARLAGCGTTTVKRVWAGKNDKTG